MSSTVRGRGLEEIRISIIMHLSHPSRRCISAYDGNVEKWNHGCAAWANEAYTNTKWVKNQHPFDVTCTSSGNSLFPERMQQGVVKIIPETTKTHSLIASLEKIFFLSLINIKG